LAARSVCRSLRLAVQCRGLSRLFVLSGRRDMQLLVIQCRHQLKNFQCACLKHRTIYTRPLPYRPLSQIPTVNFPLNSVAELASIKNTTRTVTSSVSPAGELQKNTFGQQHQSSEDASMSSQVREIINPGSLATQFGIVAGLFLRHEAQSLGFRVLPDGYVRVSDMLSYGYFGRFKFHVFEDLVKNDPMRRFEMTFQYDSIDGILKRVWWVRARYGHTMLGVNPSTWRITHVGFLGTVYYITRASDWEYIREHGIPQGPDHLIQLYNESRYNNLFLDHVPVHSKALRISIDPYKAVNLGVKFFRRNNTQLIATGDWDHTIPLKALKSVVEIEFTKETLK